MGRVGRSAPRRRPPGRVEALVLVEGAHVDFRQLDGYEPPASREAAIAEHGLGGALHWSLLSEPNEEIWPAFQVGCSPLVLIASAMTERSARAVPRAEIVRGSGHAIDYATVASWAAVSRRRPVAGSK